MAGRRDQQQRLQFSLRDFLLLSLIAGLIIGFAGPFVVDLIRSGGTPPAPARPRPRPTVTETEPSAYFESAETPLD